jgi:hypothetical protein
VEQIFQFIQAVWHAASVTANVVPTSLLLSTLIMEVIRSSKMLVLTKVTQRHIPEDGILQQSLFYIFYITTTLNTNFSCVCFQMPVFI